MTKTTRFYTGVGSRSTPHDVLALMTAMAVSLRIQGWTLRSGAADGADKAFEQGAEGHKQVFLPWPGFNGHRSPFNEPSEAALELAARVHPAWGRCKHSVKRLHARNCHQVLGPTLDKPSLFCICWTPRGAETETECTRDNGGTATAIRLAARHNVPVFNLQRPETRARLEAFLTAQ